ncbi:MAG: hypothetical protein QOG20_998 [Pseudonocardiales bacterium]|jgi:hypothetical protein|nr:hypothetical protein [Pseudonocardiales bacterium]
MIRKLLAKAERAATETETEAQAYNAKAAEPMARHGVDAALLAASGEQPDAKASAASSCVVGSSTAAAVPLACRRVATATEPRAAAP